MKDFYSYWQGVLPRAHSECLRIVGADDAPDVCSLVRESCKTKICDEWSEYQRWAYIKKSCVNQSLKWLANKNRATAVESEYLRRTENGPGFVHHDNEELMTDRIDHLLSSTILTQEELEILKYLMDRKKLNDIADLMGYSLSTLKRRINEAKEKAKRFLRDTDTD